MLDYQLLHAIATQYGTPVYVYDTAKIKTQFQRLQNAFSKSDVRFFYAAKALTNINILRYIKSLGCNIDCSSFNEVQLALKAGFSKEAILYTSSNISFDEIMAAHQQGVSINIDSFSNLEKFANRYGNSYPVGIRIRPDIMAGGNIKISTGHSNSKFGIPLQDIEKVVKLANKTGLWVKCLHIHTGSEIKDVEVFAKGIEVLFELVKFFPQLEVIDLGGGFKIPYQPGEEETDIELLAQKVKEEFDFLEKEQQRKMQVWFEPGKFLVSEAGYFITTVNVLKEAGNITFAGIDSGLNHLIRPMFYGAYHVIENISNPKGEKKIYNVTGNICETDTFAENRPIAEIREGDLLMFKNAGAYGFEMASNYNSRFRPAEVMIENGIHRLIRKRDELDDLLRNQVF